MNWAIDGAVLLTYFTVIIWIGLFMGRKEESLHDFALGGRKIPWWAVLASIVAAETSAGTFLGTPGEGYTLRNFTYLQLALGTILARVIISFTFIKPYYDYQVYSIYEFLTVRFGAATKTAASGLFLITRVLASGTRLYISAVILVVGYGLISGSRPDPKQEMMIYIGAVTFVTLLTAVYTTLGGIKAVIWTDMIQAALMIGSALVAIGWLLWHIPGGWDGVAAHLNQFQEVTFFASGLKEGQTVWEQIKGVLESEYTIFAALLGSTFTTMATHGTDQDMVQRMLTAKDVKRSRLSLVLSGLADIPIVFIFLSIGILLWVFYQTHPDPNLPVKTNEIFCYYILNELPVGFRGLLVAGVFATAMGSLSAALNALATSFVRDWYIPFIRPASNEAAVLKAARISTIVFALFMILVASVTAYFVILHPKSRIIPVALGIFGYTYGSLLGVFLVGMLTKTRGNDTGNLLAMAAGFVSVAFLSGLPHDIGQMLGVQFYKQPEWVPVIEFPWRVMFGTCVTFIVAVSFSSKKCGQAAVA